MRVLFVMERRVNAGSIQAVANYIRAGDESGHTFAVYGSSHPDYPKLRCSIDFSDFDYVVFIIEARREWLSGLRLARLLSDVPRGRRMIVDTDGVYNDVVRVDGYDYNHKSENERADWIEIFDNLADKIFQPSFGSVQDGVSRLPFFGYDPSGCLPLGDQGTKGFDVVHVAHNWWRWREIDEILLPAIESVRDQMNGICFVGSWWDKTPDWARSIGLEIAFQVDPARLEELGIMIKPPVPYTDVIRVMSEGKINIMTQRPLFRYLKLLTSKYFEIFTADTIPLVMLSADDAESIYGPAGRELSLSSGIGPKLVEVLNNQTKYQKIVSDVRAYLISKHSYQNRVEEFVTAIQT